MNFKSRIALRWGWGLLAFMMVQYQWAGSATKPEADELENAKVGYQEDGRVALTTNQMISPAGIHLTFSGRPVDLAISPDESTLAVLNMKNVVLIDAQNGAIKKTVAIAGNTYGSKGASFGGILYGKDGTLYCSKVDGIQLIVNDEKKELIPAAVPAGLHFGKDEDKLLVVLNRANSLGILDLASHEFANEIPVGVAPYGIALGPKAKVYVSNWGGPEPDEDSLAAESAGTEVRIDTRGIANAGSVSVVNLSSGKQIKSIPVGLLPTGLALNPDLTRLFVANANSDSVSVIDTASDKIVETIDLKPAEKLPFGSAPNALTVSPDGKTLYVANGGNNAIAVVVLGQSAGSSQANSKESKVSGFIPTGWYPSTVKLNRQGTVLFVTNTKGVGSLAGEKTKRWINQYMGSVSIIPVPDQETLAKYTKTVEQNNRLMKTLQNLTAPRPEAKPVSVPERHGEPSLIKHVLYIIKENKTYDSLFGDMPEGNGDSSLCSFGEEVTPNHHALARQFVLLDNFNCSGVLSADGHQWTNEAYVTTYLEKAFGGFARSYPYYGNDPLAFSPSGFIWDNVLSHGLTFRNYGEFAKPSLTPADATWTDVYEDFKNNTRKVKVEISGAYVEALNPYMAPGFPGWPMTVPDVYKARVFIEELKEFEKKGNLPGFMIMCLPNDHTDGTKPGMPTPHAMVADNDLALGMIVEAVTKSKFWPETAIFVVEDDPQGGADHIDAHRTVALVISPYTKRKFLDSTNYNQTSMIKTMELILGLPAMNQFDLGATPMSYCFTDQADLTPYTVLPNRTPLDKMNPSLKGLKEPALYWAKKSLEIPTARPGMKTEDQDELLARIIWHATKGYNTRFPEALYHQCKDEDHKEPEED